VSPGALGLDSLKKNSQKEKEKEKKCSTGDLFPWFNVLYCFLEQWKLEDTK